jgi:hypothetical protein
MKPIKIQILLTHGMDQCFAEIEGLTSNLFYGNEPLSVRFDCRHGTGAQYCAENFPGVPVEVINTRSK